MKNQSHVRATPDQGWGAGLIEYPRVRPEHADTTFLLDPCAETARRKADAQWRADFLGMGVVIALVYACILVAAAIRISAEREGNEIPDRGIYRAMKAEVSR